MLKLVDSRKLIERILIKNGVENSDILAEAILNSLTRLYNLHISNSLDLLNPNEIDDLFLETEE